VIHGLATLCHDAGNGGNNGGGCPKHAHTLLQPGFDSAKRNDFRTWDLSSFSWGFLLSKTKHFKSDISLIENVNFYVLFISFFVWTVAASCNELQALEADMKTDNARPVLSISQSNHYVSIQELQDFCGVPGTCGRKMECEGQVALVKTFIDYDNVFHKGAYPHLPYEKFRIYDHPNGPSLEVWATAKDNTLIFKKIMKGRENPKERVHVRGLVVGIDMPTQNVCRRGIGIEINDAEAIFFK
jgi:hypothetical protein